MVASGERCLARIELDDDVVDWLSERPMGAHEVNRCQRCALEAKHIGAHGALGQQGDGVEWWVRWTLTASEIQETDICPAELPPAEADEDSVICFLYVGHPGRHSFELA